MPDGDVFEFKLDHETCEWTGLDGAGLEVS